MRLDKESYTLEEFIAMARSIRTLVPVAVEKMRYGFTIGGIICEYVQVWFNGPWSSPPVARVRITRACARSLRPWHRCHAQHQLRQGGQTRCRHGADLIEPQWIEFGGNQRLSTSSHLRIDEFPMTRARTSIPSSSKAIFAWLPCGRCERPCPPEARSCRLRPCPGFVRLRPIAPTSNLPAHTQR